jgi:hypothetical protein
MRDRARSGPLKELPINGGNTVTLARSRRLGNGGTLPLPRALTVPPGDKRPEMRISPRPITDITQLSVYRS